MTEAGAGYPHLSVPTPAQALPFTARAGGSSRRLRDMDPRVHGGKLRGDLVSSIDASLNGRTFGDLSEAELRAFGTVLVLESGGPAFPLKLESLETFSRH